MLASGGSYRPLALRCGQPLSAPRTCLSPGACQAIRNALERPLPGDEIASQLGVERGTRSAAFKTGTSTGHRDAWCFAYNDTCVAGVWLGNTGGRPSRELVGARWALPLAAKLLALVPPSETAPMPSALQEVQVCSVSGLPPSPCCPHTETVLIPRAQFLHSRCGVHVADSTHRTIERWPGSTRGWDLARIPLPAEKATSSPSSSSKRGLDIKVPSEEGEYLLTGARDGDLLTLIASRSTSEPLHWYVDDTYLGRSQPHAPLRLPLTLGKHLVACMSDTGETASVRFSVLSPEG